MDEQNDGRWPKEGDQIFLAGRDAYFAERAPERDFRLVRGYKRAGDILTESALTDRCNRDSLIFPIFFSYRHYLEVTLKVLIQNHGAYAGVLLGPKDHFLPELWKLYVTIATAFGNDCLDGPTVAVKQITGEFARIDRGSTTFRYARDRAGTGIPILPTEGIDPVNLRNVMSGLENYFEYADLEFTQKAEQSAEALCI